MKEMKFKGGSFKYEPPNIPQGLKIRGKLMRNSDALLSVDESLGFVLENAGDCITEINGAEDYKDLLTKPEARAKLIEFADSLTPFIFPETKKKKKSGT